MVIATPGQHRGYAPANVAARVEEVSVPGILSNDPALPRLTSGTSTISGLLPGSVERYRVATVRDDRAMEVLSSRILVRPSNPAHSRRFYRDVLGLAIYREFGPAEDPGLVFFLGQGLLEVSGKSHGKPGGPLQIWLQVRDVRAERERLVAAGATVMREPRQEAWGLVEMWIEDPDGVRIVLVEVPVDHPLRRRDAR